MASNGRICFYEKIQRKKYKRLQSFSNWRDGHWIWNVDFRWKNFSFLEFFQSSFMIKCLIRVNEDWNILHLRRSLACLLSCLSSTGVLHMSTWWTKVTRSSYVGHMVKMFQASNFSFKLRIKNANLDFELQHTFLVMHNFASWVWMSLKAS